jgi:hypothetical protein
MLSDLRGDSRADDLWCGGGIVHPPPGAVTGKPMGHVEGLLEVMAEREVEERPAGGDQFHGGRESALNDRQVADGQMAVQVMDVGMRLDAIVRRQ